MLSEKVRLVVGVLTLHLCDAGFLVASRAALNLGVTKVVFTVYRNVIALILLAPFAFFLERNSRPPLTFPILVKFFLLALCGITANQGFYILGMYYLPPTFASGIQNSLPAVTFFIAAILRMENVHITRLHGLAKVTGTAVTVVGATIITLYKGPPLLNQPPPDHKENGFLPLFSSLRNEIQDWTLGCIYIILNTLAWSAWMIAQVPVLKVYPARISMTTFTCFFGLIQFMVIAAFVETDLENWKVQSAGGLFTVLYSGIVGTGIGFSIQLWCIDRAGPLFVAVFQPIQTAAVAVMAFLILGDQLYSGGVIGIILIIVGLYFVLWGKNKEQRDENEEKAKELRKRLLEDDDDENRQEKCMVSNSLP